MDSPAPGRFSALFSRLAGGSKFVASLSLTVAGRVVRTLLHLLVGGFITIVVLAIYTLNQRPDLSLWHEVELEGEFTEKSDAESFTDYLAIEEALFAEVKEEVYALTEPAGPDIISRYRAGSPANPNQDPNHGGTDWNRTFEWKSDGREATAGVLLLHGMSDSPYSVRTVGEALHRQGAHVVGLRLPGHGTAPSGLVTFEWEDMAAAVRLAMEHLRTTVGDKPLYLVGYSNGGALSVHYVLDSLLDDSLPRVSGVVLLSPAIGVSPMAALAVWQARAGHWLGLEKLAWNSIETEYDPYKYVSFAVNAGHQVYRLTSEIRKDFARLAGSPELKRFPPVLAFQSAVDATVSTPALIEGLFEKLPENGHELVLFDINRVGIIRNLVKNDPGEKLATILKSGGRNFTVTILSNQREAVTPSAVEVRSFPPAAVTSTVSDPGLAWPDGLYSLSHIAVPFRPDDSLYGSAPLPETSTTTYRIGNVTLRGERGILAIPATDQLRLRWNPFYPFLEERVLAFTRKGIVPE